MKTTMTRTAWAAVDESQCSTYPLPSLDPQQGRNKSAAEKQKSSDPSGSQRTYDQRWLIVPIGPMGTKVPERCKLDWVIGVMH